MTFSPARPEVASTQPCQCVYSRCSVFVQREKCRWPLLQSAPPKRSDIAVSSQVAEADVCLQSKNDVVMTVQQLSVLGLWISAMISLMNGMIPSPDVFLSRTWECGSLVPTRRTFFVEVASTQPCQCLLSLFLQTPILVFLALNNDRKNSLDWSSFSPQWS